MQSLRTRITPILLRPQISATSRHAFRTMSSSCSSSLRKITCSQGEDETKLTSETLPLTTEGGGQWRLTDDGRGVERTFRFKTFKATWDFMNTVAAECKTAKHHPEWSNVYNKTHILWTTHKPEGLSSKDVHMARFCDQAASEHGELGEGEESRNCKS